MAQAVPLRTAVSATLHCLTGCAIGEVLGLVIGTAVGLSQGWTIVLAVSLAFVFGYALSMRPLLRAGLGLGAALSVALAADTLSIVTMEIVDNAVIYLMPGAMEAGLDSLLFWATLAFALSAAFMVALPVNWVLLRRGLGHALAHKYHGHSGGHGMHGNHGGHGSHAGHKMYDGEVVSEERHDHSLHGKH